MPDDVVYEDELPLTATGKVSKLTLNKNMKIILCLLGKSMPRMIIGNSVL